MIAKTNQARIMNLTALLNVGRLAAVMRAAAKLSAEIGSRIVPVLLKIVELENQYSQPGQGAEKLKQLLLWAAKQFLSSEQTALVAQFADAIVALLNALKIFRK